MRGALVLFLALAAVVRGEASTRLVLRAGALTVDPAVDVVALPMRIETAMPAGGTIEVRARDGTTWTTTANAEQLAALQTLALPSGVYDLSLHLERHRHLHVTIRVDATHPDAPRVVRVAAAPVIRGAVVRASSGAPLANARVTLVPTGEQITTDASGRFAFEIADRWPDEVMVAASGFGTLRLPVPAAEASVDLPRAMMARAAKIRVKAGRVLSGLTAELIRREDEASEARVVAVKRFAGAREVVFDDVASGSWIVVVRGPQPLQCIGVRAGVAAGDERVLHVPLPIRFAKIDVRRGDAAYANARVTVNSIASGWSSTFTAGANGEIESEVWEGGWLEVGVRDDANSAPFIGRLVIPELQPLPAPVQLTVTVPDRRVRGRVLDPGGAPVANALVTLRSVDSEFLPTIRARTSDNGEFVYSAVAAGRQLLQVFVPGFLRPDPLPFELRDDERLREVHVQLQRGAPRALEVMNTHGAPAIGALVVCADGPMIRSIAFTDSHGRADVATPHDRPSRLYLFPNEGSLAVRTLKAEDRDIARVIVPPGNSSLEIATLTADGAALPDVGLLMRFNGEMIPPAVAREMNRYQGVALGTDENGTAMLRHIPSGVYEFWPYRTEEEATSIMASGVEAPINVNVITGANKAAVRFRKKP